MTLTHNDRRTILIGLSGDERAAKERREGIQIVMRDLSDLEDAELRLAVLLRICNELEQYGEGYMRLDMIRRYLTGPIPS